MDRVFRFRQQVPWAILLLFFLFGGFPAVQGRDIDELRSLQQRELDSLEAKYSKKAREVAGRPDGTVDVNNKAYQHIEQEYFEKAQAIKEKYRNQDVRGAEIDRVKKGYKGLVDVSGSKPKDVRADVDLTAKTDEAAKKLADEWRRAGDSVVYDPNTGKYVNKTKDATLWEPVTPQRQAARQRDHDAFVTAGGKDAAGVKGPEAVPDPLGYNYDNQQKFDHASADGDMKTQGKSVSKAAESTGHRSETTQQADALRNYNNTDEAGITRLGESKEVKEKKIQEWQKNAQKELEITLEKARKTSELKQETRRKLADQVDKTSKGNADQNWKDQLSNEPGQSKKKSDGPSAGDDTAKAIRDRADVVDTSNRQAEGRIQQGEPKSASADAPKPPDSGGPDGDAGARTTETAASDAADPAKKSAGAEPIAEPTVREPKAASSDAGETVKKTSNTGTDADRSVREPKTSTGETVDAGKKTSTGSTDVDTSIREPKTVVGEGGDPGRKAASGGGDADVAGRKAGSGEAPGSSKGSADAGGPSKTRVGGAGDAYNTADDAIQIIDAVNTVVEGAKEGDKAKMASPILGQDTSERARMKGAKEWDKEEGKALDSKTTEVASEIEAKLRRMDASKDEASKARDQYEKGDRTGFHQTVKEVKDRGGVDTENRSLDPGGPLQEEDGMVERAKEGAKQTGKYVDAFLGGVHETTERSLEEMKELNKEEYVIDQSIQTEVDNAVTKKLKRMNVSFEEARDALDAKRKGDPAKWNKILKDLHESGAVDTGQEGQGVEADGKTVDVGDWSDSVVDQAKEKVENVGRIFQKGGENIAEGANAIVEWMNSAETEEMRENERAAGFYTSMRKYDVPKEEAMEAAREYAENEDTSKVNEIYKKYVKPRKDAEQAEKRAREKEAKDKRDLKDAEAESSDVPDEDLEADEEGKPRSGLGGYADERDEQRQKTVEDSRTSMKEHTRVAEASNEGNIEEARAEIAKDSAGREGQEIQRDAVDKAAAEQEKNSWGTTMADATEKGITTGIQVAGAKMGQAVAKEAGKAIFGDSKEEKKKKEEQAKAAAAAAASTAGKTASGAASSASSGKTASAKKTSGKSSSAKPSSASRSRVAVNPGASASSTASGTSSPSKSSAHSCPSCGGDMRAIVTLSDGERWERWDCFSCDYYEFKKGGSGSSSSSAAAATAVSTPEINAQQPSPPPKPKKTRQGCGVEGCGAPVTYQNDHYLYGSVYKCSNGHTIKGVDVITVEVDE